ncbi:DUF6153 family protein [Microbacterium sp. NPDC058062]|uniref:DUF6153 family protein n=1 Tax=Microbacterium sp. NPDC058062 TaxID=3346320 RepID=UPI0036DCF016
MRTIRAFAWSWSSLVRGVMCVALALGVILGLLAMHTLGGGDIAHSRPTATLAAPAEMPNAWMIAHAGLVGHEPCDCGPSTPAPDHSMLTMACVLGLLVTLLVVAVPFALGRVGGQDLLLGLAPGLARRRRAHARAPSLLVLSVSRT